MPWRVPGPESPLLKISLSVSPDNPPRAPIIMKGGLRVGIERAATWGFDAVELHIHDLDQLNVSEVRAWLAASGLPVSAVGPGLVYGGDTFSLSDPSAAVRQQAMDRLHLQIDICQQLATMAMVGVVHGNFTADRTEQVKWLSECLRECDDYARARDVTLALEAINRYETNCFNRAVELVALIEENALASSGVLLDTFHMNIEESSIEDAIRTAGKHLRLVHFPDSNRWYPGAGHLDLHSIVRALREIGYDGYLALEALPLPDPETAARKGLENLRRLLDA